MSKLQMILFCAATLLLSLGAAVVLFPYAAVPMKVVTAARTPKPMQDLPDINLGADYGTIPVTELVGYYMDHPPKPQVMSGGGQEEQFGGC
jgi:hypothetical protein